MSTLEPYPALEAVVEMARRKCATDHDCALESVVVVECDENDGYEPGYPEHPPRDLPDGRSSYAAIMDFNYTAHATHAVTFSYDPRGYRATYGVNALEERRPELWAD